MLSQRPDLLRPLLSPMSKPRRLIYPPIWLVFGLVTIFLLDEYAALVRFTGASGWAVGALAILVGLILLINAGGLFKQAGTDLVPFQDVTALVTEGVYRYTRNPMYLGMALVLLGTALTVGALSALFVPPLFMLIIQLRFVGPEEVMMKEIFGADYDAYCQRVRRWL